MSNDNYIKVDEVEKKLDGWDKRPPMPRNFQWISICSAHRDYDPGCPRCSAGHWVNDDYKKLEHWLYEQNYKLWHKWANQDDTSSGAGFLEKIFPKLRRKK
jgi:hypothetical protein